MKGKRPINELHEGLCRLARTWFITELRGLQLIVILAEEVKGQRPRPKLSVLERIIGVKPK